MPSTRRCASSSKPLRAVLGSAASTAQPEGVSQARASARRVLEPTYTSVHRFTLAHPAPPGCGQPPARDREARAPHPAGARGSPRAPAPAHAARVLVAAPVHFHDQRHSGRDEVRDEAPDHHLPPELHTQLPPVDGRPQRLLRRREPRAHLPSVLLVERRAGTTEHGTHEACSAATPGVTVGHERGGAARTDGDGSNGGSAGAGRRTCARACATRSTSADATSALVACDFALAAPEPTIVDPMKVNVLRP